MISPQARTRLGWLACAGAALAGVLAAVAVSGAAEQRAGSITIRGDSLDAITVRGSDFADEAVISRTLGTGFITISGSTITSERLGCEAGSSGDGSYTCPAKGVKEISVILGDQRDRLEFAGNGLDDTLTIRGSTGAANDRLFGSQAPETLKGGGDRDLIEAGGGDDNLNGGPDRDQLDGGKGKDKCDDDLEDKSVIRCETTHLR
ncbi:MAG: hypothetical protein QOI31_428 [Solirubrobacterales bacterium]|jgi:Ca2+-binding RTX toxin-like protein|nr:hypothetical protein [Solirubrobacterales bacterium]